MDGIQIYLMLGVPFVGYFLWEIYGIYRDTRPNILKAVFIDAGKTIRNRRVKMKGDGKSFTITIDGKPKKYSVTEQCVYRVGTWRIPTTYYNLGKSTPLDLRGMTATNPISDEDFHQATEANVARQIIDAFDTPFITITSATAVILIVVAVANAAVYFQLNTALEEIKTAVGIVSNAN